MTIDATPETKDRELSEPRVAARARWSEMMRAFMHLGALRGKSYASRWAAKLGVSRQLVERWANPLAPKGQIAAGDLGALDPIDLRDLLTFWLECVEKELSTRAKDSSRTPEFDALIAANRIVSLANKISGDIVQSNSAAGAPHRLPESIKADTAELNRWLQTLKHATSASEERR